MRRPKHNSSCCATQQNTRNSIYAFNSYKRTTLRIHTLTIQTILLPLIEVNSEFNEFDIFPQWSELYFTLSCVRNFTSSNPSPSTVYTNNFFLFFSHSTVAHYGLMLEIGHMFQIISHSLFGSRPTLALNTVTWNNDSMVHKKPQNSGVFLSRLFRKNVCSGMVMACTEYSWNKAWFSKRQKYCEYSIFSFCFVINSQTFSF
jgi:hypothetical protein